MTLRVEARERDDVAEHAHEVPEHAHDVAEHAEEGADDAHVVVENAHVVVESAHVVAENEDVVLVVLHVVLVFLHDVVDHVRDVDDHVRDVEDVLGEDVVHVRVVADVVREDVVHARVAFDLVLVFRDHDRADPVRAGDERDHARVERVGERFNARLAWTRRRRMRNFRSISLAVLFPLFAACGGGAAATGPAPATPASPPASATATPPPPATAAPTASATTPPAPQEPAAPEVPPMTTSGATLTWYGHAAFKLVTPSGKIIWFDPWIQNPKNPTGKDDLAKIDKADLILVSHGHFDHVGDAAAIAKKTHAKLVSTFDLGRALVSYMDYPKDLAGFDSQGNFGGDVSFFDGEVTVSFVPAVHSSTVDATGKGAPDLRPGGAPGGFVVTIKNGPVVYHTGDTDLFADMALIPQFHKVNVMLACMGDHFTMGPDRAAEAVRLVAPTVVVPMHFGTFPVLTGTPEALDAAMKKKGLRTQMKAMQVHEEMKL